MVGCVQQVFHRHRQNTNGDTPYLTVSYHEIEDERKLSIIPIYDNFIVGGPQPKHGLQKDSPLSFGFQRIILLAFLAISRFLAAIRFRLRFLERSAVFLLIEGLKHK